MAKGHPGRDEHQKAQAAAVSADGADDPDAVVAGEEGTAMTTDMGESDAAPMPGSAQDAKGDTAIVETASQVARQTDREVAQLRLPIPIDTYIAPYGRIAAVMWDGTERLYFFIDKRGCVALMPADCIERWVCGLRVGGDK